MRSQTSSRTAGARRDGGPPPQAARGSHTGPGPQRRAGRPADAAFYRPGIDGLRAAAVLAIVLGAAVGNDVMASGAAMEVLFVITGYLLTAQLVTEHGGRGWINVGAFWRRRATRALPALLTVLGCVSLFALVARPDDLVLLGGEIRAALAGISNWHVITVAGPPEDPTPPLLLRHLWSVAVGVQFVAVWPVLVAVVTARGGRRRLAWLVLALVAVSVAVSVWWSFQPVDPLRARYGTDTRVGGLLMGAALAVVGPPVVSQRAADPQRTRRLRRLGVVAAGLLVFGAGVVVANPEWIDRGATLAVAVPAALLVTVLARDPGLDRTLGPVGLRWLGARAYGIYLWHWPLLVAIGGPAPTGGWLVIAGYVIGVIIAADLTYRFVEVPLRGARRVPGQGHVGRPGLALQATALACGIATVAALFTGQGDAAAEPADDVGVTTERSTADEPADEVDVTTERSTADEVGVTTERSTADEPADEVGVTTERSTSDEPADEVGVTTERNTADIDTDRPTPSPPAFLR